MPPPVNNILINIIHTYLSFFNQKILKYEKLKSICKYAIMSKVHTVISVLTHEVKTC